MSTTTPSYDLYSELTIKTKDLDTCIKQLRRTGSALAEAEKEYQVKKAEKALRLRDEGMPVGLIDLTIRGDKEVAALRFTRDCKKVTYDANQEAVQAIKLQMRLIEGQIQREYGVAGRGTI